VAEIQTNIKADSQFGTLTYMAPEVIFGHTYTYTADYYSVGVLLLLMVTGDMLSVGKTIKDAKHNIALRRDTLTTSRFIKRYPNVSHECCDLIVKLITTSQHLRIGAKNRIDEIFQHNWFDDIDIDSVRSQTLQSPIYDIVTNKENIMRLTEVSPNKYTQYWENKEVKALKNMNKTVIDDGEYFRNEFSEFDCVIVEEADTEGKHRDSMMTIRRHTMSSIRKQKERSDSVLLSGSVDDNDSPFENAISPFDRDSEALSEKKNTDPNEPK